jgi:putative transposase
MVKKECLYECRVGRIEADITTFWMLSKMCWVGTKLYNTALWNAKETWDKTGKIPTGYDLHKIVQVSGYHQLVPTHTSQRCADLVGQAFRSWFTLRKKDKTARPPRFRRKEELSTITFTQFGFHNDKYRKELLFLTVGKKMREEQNYPNKFLPLHIRWSTPLPPEGELQAIDIVPRGGFFEIHAKVSLPIPVWKQDGQVVAIDLGQKVPIAAVFETGEVELFKGGAIQSSMRYWNKERKHVQEEVMGRTKGKREWSNALTRMSQKAAHQKKQQIHAMTSTFVQLCVDRNVKEVVVGDLGGIKKKKNGTGKNWNDKSSQNWQQLPVQEIVAQLGYKLARHAILKSEQDERGTSKGRCSACGCTDRKKIHRVHRGMFLCENCGITQHADANGGRNQLARYLHQEVPIEIGTSEGSSGGLAPPSVWRWDGHRWKSLEATI